MAQAKTQMFAEIKYQNSKQLIYKFRLCAILIQYLNTNSFIRSLNIPALESKSTSFKI